MTGRSRAQSGRPRAGGLAAVLTGTALLAAACEGGSQGGSAGQSVSTSGPGTQQQFLAYSQCMRSHGDPGFPDPTASGHGVGLQLAGTDPNSLQFQAAQQACHMPGS